MSIAKRVAWDSDFFGYEIYSIEIHKLEKDDLAIILNELKDLNVKLVYLISTDTMPWVSQLNGKLVDEKIIYLKKPSYKDCQISGIEKFSANESYIKLVPLALQSGAYSRFKTDSNFKNSEFENLYIQWIKKSVDRSIASEIFVYKEFEKVLGMITIKLNSDKATIGLLAVDEKERGKRIGQKLINKVESYSIQNNCSTIEVATQKENIAACQFYEKNGFFVSKVYSIYHFWL